MKTILKYAATVALTGALALAAATPSEARHGRNAAIIGGVAAGVFLGAAAASANSGYYGSGYAEPGYGYEPGYAYEPAPVYMQPAPRYRSGGCWHSTDSERGYGYYGACY